MGIHHCAPGEVLNLIRLNDQLPRESTFAVVKTETMEIIRMFLTQGKQIPEHSVSGEITVQCLSGRLAFTVEDEVREMEADDWLFLSGDQKHALRAIEDSILLVTIYLK